MVEMKQEALEDATTSESSSQGYNGRLYHTETPDTVARLLETSITDGLSTEEAKRRQAIFGPNDINTDQQATWVKVLIHQLTDVMNWTFLILGIAAYVLKDYITGTMLVALALLNLYMIFSQEYAAEKTLATLKGLSSPEALVVRDGHEQILPTRDVVPGDLLVIKGGDSVAADARIIHVANVLETDEALLTGESLPVQKNVAVLGDPELSIGDRTNMIYSSTTVSKGRGRAIVTAISMETEIGKVAAQLNENSNQGDRTKLQKSLNRLYFSFLALAVVLACIVLATVKFQNIDYGIGMYSLTAALSVLPAGLTTVIAVTLVMGGKEMKQQKALVRRLKCLETLGSVTNIFSDKTGTLTVAKMVAVQMWLPDEGFFHVESNGLEPQGDLFRVVKNKETAGSPECYYDKVDKTAAVSERMRDLVHCAALCNDSSIRQNTAVSHQEDLSSICGQEVPEDVGEWVATGAPTEVALQVLAHKFNMGKPDMLKTAGWVQLADYQFDSTIKRMSALYYNRQSRKTVLFSKGAAESILPLCDNVQDPDNVMERVDQLASRGLRVIMLAKRTIDDNTVSATLDDDDEYGYNIAENGEKWSKHFKREDVECHLEFLGITGIYDPPRAESRESVAAAHRAGIVVHMLTGDHRITATAIAKEINILSDKLLKTKEMDKLVMTGPQFDSMTEEQVDALPYLPLVVARCSPETKVKMIQASQRRRLISAMTGDGVNDSPSLRIADVGVAMGKNGSDVAKQASDVVLTDDNFATIIRAIAEGRRIYQNIQLFLEYYYILLFGIALLPMISLAVHDPTGRSVAPFSTLQMVYYFLAGAPPAGELSTLPASRTLMHQPPRPPDESLLNREILLDTFVYSVFLGLSGMAMYILILGGFTVDGADCDLDYQPGPCDRLYRARATLFVYFSFVMVVIMAHCRSYREPEWSWRGIKATFTSRTVTGTLLLYTICSVVFINVSVVAIKGFRMTRITWEWGLAFGFIVLYILVGELYKCIKRKWIGRWLTRVHTPDTLLLSS